MVSSPIQPSHPTALDSLLARLQGVRKALHGWTARCPAHQDRQPSLSIDQGEEGHILLKCFAGCSLEAIVSAVGMNLGDLFPPPAADHRSGWPQGERLTLLDLAVEKMLPWKYLMHLGVSEERAGVLRIPYSLPDGTPAPRHRLRTALVAREGSRWSRGKGQIVPYGLDRLETGRRNGSLVLVEGESDCWTLWLHGFAALGLPGAEMVGTLEESYLSGIETLYIVREPDAAGASFVNHLQHRLQGWQWPGKALVVSLPAAKDANELYKQEGKGFKAAFQRALEHAEPLHPPPAGAAGASAQVRPTPFTLQDLLARELPPLRWAVPDILPEGLALLAGKPKLGKSWLALSIALAIAAGGVALGKQAVTQGEVLYLALEDNERRLQSRARKLLEAMSAVPAGLEFALQWPRLDQGGLQCLEEYLQAHPKVRLVIVDTWVKVSPQAHSHQQTQYEHEYEALTPLKFLADRYRVSILAVHHLRKTAGEDVLDEITGSTGLTGVVDGALVLKRERGQGEASLFVTGRDIDQEQQFALTFDGLTAQWVLRGLAEEFKHTKERQEILDLLGEQLPAGMRVREVAEALHKNYHTTRALLRKMEDAGEVLHRDNQYFVLPQDVHQQQRNHCNQRNQPGVSALSPPALGEQLQKELPPASDYADYTDYADYSEEHGLPLGSRSCAPEPAGDSGGLQEVAGRASHGCVRGEAQPSCSDANSPSVTVDLPACERPDMQHPPYAVGDTTGERAHQRMDRASHERGTPDPNEGKRRCPRHPHAGWVRFDPSGQAWCDRMDCWNSYRLMKIGEALGYQRLRSISGTAESIEEGIEAWSSFVASQSPFAVVAATQQAISLCRKLEVDIPDLSSEVRHLVPA